MVITAPESASDSVASTRIAASTAVAPEASASTSGCGKRCGATSTSFDKPIVCIARAVAPMLPGWLVAHRTMRMRSSVCVMALGSCR